MAGRTPRTGSGRHTADGARETRHDAWPELDDRLVRVRDLAGRPRGTGFLADHDGTLITSHEAVDGLARIVLHAAGDRTCVVGSDAVTPLPAHDLALIRTEGLCVPPLPITVRDRIPSGTYVRIAADRWREARVLAAAEATYTATDRFHLLPEALELAMGTAGRDALRLGGGAAGGPVLDTETGAVLAVLGTALRSGHRDVGFAVPLHHTDRTPLTDLLARNAATVPAHGIDLNLAGILELTTTSLSQDAPHIPESGPSAAWRGAGNCAIAPHAHAAESGPSGPRRGAGNCAIAPHAPAAESGPSGPRRGAGNCANGPHAAADGHGSHVQPVERAAIAEELSTFAEGTGTSTATGTLTGTVTGTSTGTGTGTRTAKANASVLALVGAPGTGRTTELAALAARRTRAPDPAPTLWIRGADLEDTDDSVADAARRALERAVRTVAAARSQLPGDLGELTVERLARLAARAGRPLLLLLDGPEEMPPLLAHRLPAWTAGTAAWLRDTGARLLFACREEYWERAGAEFPPDLLHRTADADDLACVRLPGLTPDEARRARSSHGVPDGALTERDAGHPLALRLLSEVRAALPDAPDAGPLDRYDVFAAHLDLLCLRIAVRVAAGSGLRGTALRRLAARVCGQVHEAARRSLGPGLGELDRESFEAVFPPGPAPARLGGGSSWASAVLTEGLLVPAGAGYRFAHEEFADWIQGSHLDVDEALHALVHRPRTPDSAHPQPVPHHRVGPVVQALLLLDRQYGPAHLGPRLNDLAHALDLDPGSWWAARLLAQTLPRLPDATPYTGVLRLLADRVVGRRRTAPAGFGPDFWTALALPDADRFDLLRRLVRADEPPPEPADEGRFGTRPTATASTGRAPRYLDAVARLLAADPAVVQPCLTRWFDDERPLRAMPHATVATAAQALLHTHRHRGLDNLTEVLVDAAHRRGDELLAVLAEDEPSAMCRAVDRWAHDERPARRVAAVAHALRAAPHVRGEPDRALLRYAALALLARPADCALHGGALALLVRDPWTRTRHLPQALRHFATGDPQLTAGALVPAMVTHPEEVLEAFRAGLHGPAAGQVVRALADVTAPDLGHRVTELVLEAARLRPETAGQVAGFVERRLDRGAGSRAVLLPLVTALLTDGPEPVRAALATVLGAGGTTGSRPLRRELVEFLLDREEDPGVLDALLHAAAGRREEDGDRTRELVRRTGLLLVRTPDGATRFDRGLVDLGRHVPGFAALMIRWLTDTPEEWAAVVGPSTRRMLGNLAGARVPA
ncbi:trypsin-like peptidase domain-containing protein [Streptomyces sp. NPDC093970]|uniref:trypsin-like peptidase domain-containing protein n=1 Tax=Streptomyces sp. NPDC093970 TaxID=3155076 RepID=UPI003420E53B